MKSCGAALGLSALFAALCALCPDFAGWAAEWVSTPVNRAIAALNAAAGLPVVLIALCATAIAAKPRALAAIAVAAVLFSAAWTPVATREYETVPEAPRERLVELCARLVCELNANGRCVAAPEEALELAREAMNAPAAPRAALLPGIMRGLKLAGIYVPVAGEAVVDVTRPAAGLVFTAAHELAHMLGVADETQANIMAYEKCVAHGGAAAYSARLWALRYALDRLGGGDYAARLDPAIYSDMNSLPCAVEGGYAALADYLARR